MQVRGSILGITSAVLLAVVLLIPVKIIQALSLLGLVLSGSQFLFHGSTPISIALEGKARRYFQIGISVAVPLVMSMYFVKDAPVITFEGILGHMFSVWFLLPIGIIGYVSWAFADQLDKEHPFRGFLIACAVIFVIYWMGYHGIYSEHDNYRDTNSFYIDEENAMQAARTGRYFGQFLIYVAVSYIAMLLNRHLRAKKGAETRRIHRERKKASKEG